MFFVIFCWDEFLRELLIRVSDVSGDGRRRCLGDSNTSSKGIVSELRVLLYGSSEEVIDRKSGE